MGTVVKDMNPLLIHSVAWTVPTSTDTVDGTLKPPRTTATPTGLIPTPEKTLTNHGSLRTSDPLMDSLELLTPVSMSTEQTLIPLMVICGGTPLADGEWYKCGTHYTVKGLMNTYDEFAQQEFGTMQEFWFQFHYHFVFQYDAGTERNADHNRDGAVNGLDVDVTDSTYANGAVGYDHRHNFPNILFNAFDVSAISMYCDDVSSETRMNSNAR